MNKVIPTLLLATLFHLTGFTQTFKAIDTKEGTEIWENGKKVLFYQFAPASINGKYERAGYIHPLYSLEGNVITEDHPADHLHHHGIFWAWHQITLKGQRVADSWMSENISWQPVSRKVKKEKEKILLEASLIWNLQLAKKERLPIIDEHTAITIYRSTEKYRILDINIHLRALTDSLALGGSTDGKDYGGFSLRWKLPEDILFLSADSVVKPTNKPALAGPWMNFIGSFDGSSSPASAVAVFCAEPLQGGNQPWILRKAESMQNVVYPGATPVPLTRKGSILSYRLVIQHTPLSQAELQKMYVQYILGK